LKLRSLSLNINGNYLIGVNAIATDTYSLVPLFASRKVMRKLTDNLKIDVFKASIFGSGLLGLFCVGNSKGLLITDLIFEEELEKIKELLNNINVNTIPIKLSAIGNLISANDFGAVVSPLIPDKFIPLIESTLGVKAQKIDVPIPTIGSLLLATNKGCIVSPLLSDEIAIKIEQILEVPTSRILSGKSTPFYPKLYALANSFGILFSPVLSGRIIMEMWSGLFF